MENNKKRWPVWPDYNTEKYQTVFGENIIRWNTRVRKKSKLGFYFLTDVVREYYVNNDLLENSNIVFAVEQGIKLFISDAHNVYTQVEYSHIKDETIGRNLFIVDRYQGPDHTKIDPKYLFQYYDPEWDWETLKEVNKQMEIFNQ